MIAREIVSPAQAEFPFEQRNIANQDSQLHRTRDQCRDGGALRAEGGHPKLTVDQCIVEKAVDHKGRDGEIQRDPHRSDDSQCIEQDLCDGKDQISETDDPKIGHTFGDDYLIRRKDQHQLARKQARSEKEHDGQNHSCPHRAPCKTLYRSHLFLAVILCSQDHGSLPDGNQEILVHKLDLVDSRDTRESLLAVGAEHHVVRQVDAQRDDVLQNQYDPHDEKVTVKFLIAYHTE